MKKLLLSTAAVGLALSSVPAHADIDLELGGYFKGYGAWVADDNAPQSDDVNGQEDADNFDFVRDTELHVNGETTLDNGLTVGAHVELSVDGADGATSADESYAYFTGSWGRVNFGDEDGAAYLLQVAAPSADSNVDGIRQFVQPFNYDALFYDGVVDTGARNILDGDGVAAVFMQTQGGLDYDHDLSGKSTKLTYLSPVFSGFQGGASYTPNPGVANDLEGVGIKENGANGAAGTFFGDVLEAALRYEGQWDQLGVALGAGWAWQNLEAPAYNPGNSLAVYDPTDDRQSWNVGGDFNFGPFGLGVVYMEDDHGDVALEATDTRRVGPNEETFVVGADYTTGAFKFGLSYLDSNNTFGISQIVNNEVKGFDSERWTGGVVYTYGPGMTFNGSVSFVEHKYADSNLGGVNDDKVDSTAVMIGTQVNF